METLPAEIVEKVGQHLTPQDLARCCAVSPKWREIFDQDWLWKPHCDPELEEPLRTTPSVVNPVFVSPKDENSTLTPISKWRLAFLREQHIWGNWKRKNWEAYSLESDNDNIQLRRSFLSNNLLIKWCTRSIQVWDVSMFPATLLAETDSYLDIEGWINCSVLDSNTLLLEKKTCVQVFLVDIINKSIMLKHEIPLDEKRNLDLLVTKQVTSVEGNVILGITASDLYLSILDLEKGKKLKVEPCPVMKSKHGNANIYDIKTSSTSDDVLVSIHESNNCYHYIYSLQQKLFLPGPIAVNSSRSSYCNAINKHYVAFGDLPSMTILDYHTSEVVFENEDQEESILVQAYKDSFIFIDWKSEHCWLNIFSLTNKTIITVLQYSTPKLWGTDQYDLQIVNNKFVVLFGRIDYIKSEDDEDTWDDYLETSITFQPSGQSLKRAGFFLENCEINKAYTRGLSPSWEDNSVIYYYW